MRARTRIRAAICCGLLLLAACAGPLYKVAPLPSSPPPEIASATAGKGLEVGAAALADERAYERFGANLPLAGVIAVDVRIANRTAAPIALGRMRFELRSSAGGEFRPLEPKKALSRVMKYYGVRLYGKESYRQTRAAYEGLALDLDGELAPGEERRGVIYFEARPPLAEYAGLTLVLSGHETEIQLPLD